MANMTKRALADSLIKLLRTKPITKVTINDITEACGVNRMTFYYHFKDIYDLVEWIFANSLSTVLENKELYGSWQNGLLHILMLYKSNQTLIMNVYHHVGTDYIENYIESAVFKMVYSVVESRTEKLNITNIKEEDILLITDFYKYAITGLLMNWVKKGMKDEPEEIVKKLNIVTSGNVDEVLKKLEVESGGYRIG
jgi:probable dihydroxyacetone kinase regulator